MPRKSTAAKGKSSAKGKAAPPRKSRSKAPKRARKAPSKARRTGPIGRDPSPRRRGLKRRLFALLILAAGVGLAINVAILWEQVSERMDGRTHDEPARITGRVPRLAPGAVATEEGWRRVFSSLGYEDVGARGRVGPGSFAMDGARWTVQAKTGPAVDVVVRNRRVESLKDRSRGITIPAVDFHLPAVSLLTGRSRERRSVTLIGDMPQALVRAVVSIEDERFHRHAGIDPRGIARAAFNNIRSGGVAQGGSTITQQLAKNMFLTAERTASRKFQEALIALILERRYGKDRILEAYLNEIYLGQRDGWAILGVAEAARAWFGKSVDALTVSESALLAGAIHAPNRTVPWRHPEEAKRRRATVLRKMAELEAVPADDIQDALTSPLPTTNARGLARTAPWFIDGVVSDLRERYTPEALHRDGLELVTTLDPLMQRAAEKSAKATLSSLERSHPNLFEGASPEVALIAMDPRDGAIRALVGGADYGRSQFDRAREARRQPGSAFKPIVLASSIAARWPSLRPGTLVEDSPLAVPGAGPRGSAWKPKNWDNRFLGPIPLRVAVEKSRNLPFVRLGMADGLDEVVSTAEAMGIGTPLRALPSLSIGAQEVTLLDLAVAYATLAADGVRPVPRMLEGVRARDGSWLERALPERGTGLDPRVTRMVTAMLQGVVERGTARGIRRAGFKLPLAAKTGTSNDSRDAWTAGYTPDLVVIVWVGFDQDRTLGLTSTRAAVPFFTSFLQEVEPLLAGRKFPIGPTPAGPPEAKSPDTPGTTSRAAGLPKPPTLRRPPAPDGAANRSTKNVQRSRAELKREDRRRRRQEAAAARRIGQ